MSRLKLATEQIVFARNYTIWLLDNTKTADWCRQPAEGVTHIAWQVGHLAMAEYRLALERIRGRRPDDGELISEDFLRLFGGQSSPDSDPTRYPGVAEIRAGFDRVHQQTLHELESLDDTNWTSRRSKPTGWPRPNSHLCCSAPSTKEAMPARPDSYTPCLDIRPCGDRGLWTQTSRIKG